MKSILLTGGTGLLGSEFVSTFSDRYRVFLLSRSQRTSPHSNVHWIQHDLNHPVLPHDLPKVDFIIHLAQHGHYRDFPERVHEIFRVNIESTLSLLEYARVNNVRKFILASTGGLYGSAGRAFTETDDLNFDGDLEFYYSTKRTSELLTHSYARFFDVMTLRFFFIYGPLSASDRLFARLSRSIISGDAITLDGKDGLRFNPIHVSDAALAVQRCLEIAGSDLINVAGPNIATLREAVELLGMALQKSPRFEVLSEKPPRDLIGDISKMTSLLGPPRISLKDGIMDLYQGSRSIS